LGLEGCSVVEASWQSVEKKFPNRSRIEVK